jgi:hypothetical protein
MAAAQHVSLHTGQTVTLTDLVPDLGITCFGVRTWDARRCTHPARWINEQGWPVCGHHTKPGQHFTYVAPGQPA